MRTALSLGWALLLATVVSSAEGHELLANGGFETGDLTSWSTKPTVTVAGGDVHEGQFAARTSGRSASVRQDVRALLQPNVAYTFSAWVKLDALGTRPGSVSLRVAKSRTLGGKAYAEARADRTVTGWQQLSVTRAFTARELKKKLFAGVAHMDFTGAASVDAVSVMTASVDGVPASHAFGLWTPTRFDTCPKALHDGYAVVGPDGKAYPTWHPPIVTDPATGQPCSFGHEHGRDPRGSHLWPVIQEHFGHATHAAMSGLPFGYGNEQLDVWNTAQGVTTGMRHEDHVGHKIEWENDVRLERSVNGQRVQLPVTCDFLMKIHQGTHSADAFTNNLHELTYVVDCSNGARLIATVMTAFGAPGGFVRSCDKATIITAGTPTPPNSPAGPGVRFIPDRACPEQFVFVPAGQFSQMSLAFYEDWISANYLRTPSGQQLAYFDPHFAVFNPARYHWPAAPGGIGRVVDLCYEEPSPGLRARDGTCDSATRNGTLPGVVWDDPQSPFDGSHRETYFNQTTIDNAGGPTRWYTTPFGGNASQTPFSGAIAQYVAATSNRDLPTLESQAFGATRSYDGPGVHAPN